MDMSAFKLDIDELIEEFAEGELKTVADMKKVWLGRKFSYIFEARPSSNSALFMQTLYSHTVSHLNPTNSLPRRLGGLYCLYFLYETQPFKPPFKIYLSLGELRRLKALVIDAKRNGIKVVSVVVKRMLEKNTFLFGFVSMSEYSEKERIKELVDAQNACIQKLHEKLFANTEFERHLHMDMAMELDLEVLQRMSTEYATAKSLAVREGSEVVDIQNIKHIAEDGPLIGDEMQKISEEWDNQKKTLFQQIGSGQHEFTPVSGRRGSEQELRTPLPDAQRQYDDDGLLHDNRGFLELLMGNDSPQAIGNADQQDDELDYVKELEHQLADDLL